ncbi:MAG: hypothetical protein ACE5IR_14300 [bacterium]
MEKHIQILGILYIAFSALGLLIAFIVFVAVAGGGLLSGDTEAMMITGAVATGIAVIFGIFCLPGIIGGYGLLKRYEWARILVLILGFLNLLNIPFGTILGVYTIWALLNDETSKLFTSRASA